MAKEHEKAQGADSSVAETTMRVQDAFTCPRCGAHRLEEIVCDVTMAYEIVECSDDGYAEHHDPSNDENYGGKIDRYQCKKCGWVVPNVTDIQALFAWLQQRKKEAPNA